MKTIKNIHKAVYAPMGDLITYRALPTNTIPMEELNPFIFLNHHGPQNYKPDNNGLPFGPHPHRGMETVTFILDGDIKHKDSGGYTSTIEAGGIQWMTAGSGLIHAEVSSEKFKKEGGTLEILQLWLNLPAKHKMIKPFYKGMQKEDIPSINLDENKVTINLISGEREKSKGAFESVSNISLSSIYFKPGGKLKIDAPIQNNILLYVVKGELNINNERAEGLHLVEFNKDGTGINIKAFPESIIIFGHAEPLNEPIAAQGPFVMNSEKEITEAYSDYREGKFGNWEE